MPDLYVRIYLGLLVFLSLLFPLLYAIIWLGQSRRPRHPLVKAKLLWRDLFFLISGIVGWYIFSTRLLNNWLVMIATVLLLLLSAYLAELVGRNQSKRDETNRAT